MKTLKKVCSNIYLVFIFVLLYAPILTLMVLSFNQSKSRARWGGFTTRWYTELFQNEEILLAFRNTMVIAFLSALVATLIGLCACMAMNNMKKRWRSLFMGIANIPMLNAEIVTGISLMLVFLVISAAFAGIATAIWFFAAPAGFLVANGVVYFDVPPLLLVGLTVLSYAGIRLYDRFIRKKAPLNHEYRLALDGGKGEVVLRALCDTGLHLTEPFSGCPVIVVRQSALYPHLPPALQEALSLRDQPGSFSYPSGTGRRIPFAGSPLSDSRGKGAIASVPGEKSEDIRSGTAGQGYHRCIHSLDPGARKRGI